MAGVPAAASVAGVPAGMPVYLVSQEPPRKRFRSKRRLCEVPGCDKSAAQGTHKCKAHGGGRRCAEPGCTKSAQGSTARCVQHGGGKRCKHPSGCAKVARGATQFCVAHGGGFRCVHPNCKRGARGKSGLCKAHGGGAPCSLAGCNRSAQQNGFCRSHRQFSNPSIHTSPLLQVGAAHPAAAAAIRAVAAAAMPKANQPFSPPTAAPVSAGIGTMQPAQQMALGVVNPTAASTLVSSTQEATQTANAARVLEMAAQFRG